MSAQPDMDCEEVRRLLVAFGDGEINPAGREMVAAHLKSCAECSAELPALQASLDAFRGLGGRIGRTPLREGLAQEIAESVARQPARSVAWLGISRVAAAALLLLAVGVGMLWVARQVARPQVAKAPAPAPAPQPVTRIVQPQPAAPAPPLKTAPESKPPVRQTVAEGLFEARLAAAKMAMEPNPDDAPMPDVCLTATELYAQIPAIMLAAADQVNYAIGDKDEAARKYQRIVELFPAYKQAQIAAQRLAELRQEKEG